MGRPYCCRVRQASAGVVERGDTRAERCNHDGAVAVSPLKAIATSVEPLDGMLNLSLPAITMPARPGRLRSNGKCRRYLPPEGTARRPRSRVRRGDLRPPREPARPSAARAPPSACVEP